MPIPVLVLSKQHTLHLLGSRMGLGKLEGRECCTIKGLMIWFGRQNMGENACRDLRSTSAPPHRDSPAGKTGTERKQLDPGQLFLNE